MQLFYFDPKFPLGLNTALQLDWGLDIKYLPAKFFVFLSQKMISYFSLDFWLVFWAELRQALKKSQCS